MLQYERIDVSEGTDLDKTIKSKECDNNFSTMVLNLIQKFVMIATALGLETFTIIDVRGVGCKIFVFDMTEDDVHNILGSFESGKL